MSNSTISSQNLSLQKLVTKLGSGSKKQPKNHHNHQQLNNTRQALLNSEITANDRQRTSQFKDHHIEVRAQQNQRPINIHAPSTASIYGVSPDQQQIMEAMSSQGGNNPSKTMSHMGHQSMNSAQTTVPQYSIQLPVQKDTMMATKHHFSAAVVAHVSDHKNISPQNRTSQENNIERQSQTQSSGGHKQQHVITFQDQQMELLPDYAQTQLPNFAGIIITTEDDNIIPDEEDQESLVISRQQISDEKTTNGSLSNTTAAVLTADPNLSYRQLLQVQSQQVSLADRNQLNMVVAPLSQRQDQLSMLSQRNDRSATPVLTQSEVVLDTQQTMMMTNTMMETSKTVLKNNNNNKTQDMIGQLEQKVSSLVLKMEKMRPLAKEAQKVIESSQGKNPQSNNTTLRRAGSVNRSRSRGGNNSTNEGPHTARLPTNQPQLNQPWVTSTNAQRKGPSDSQTARLLRQSASQTRLTQQQKTQQQQEAMARQKKQDADIAVLVKKFDEQMTDNNKKVDLAIDEQSNIVQLRQQNQQAQFSLLELRVIQLQTKLAEKAERKEKRKQARQSKALAKFKASIVSSIVDQLKNDAASQKEAAVKKQEGDIETEEDSSAMLLDPATRDFIHQQLKDEDLDDSMNQSKKKEKMNSYEQVIAVDLGKINQFNSQHIQQRTPDSINIPPMSSQQPNNATNERNTVITASEPDEESLTHHRQQLIIMSPQKTKNAAHSELSSKRSPSQLIDTKVSSAFVGYLDQIKLALEKLEAYSLRSSEDINDSIEQLVSCFNSNTSALQRALEDLKHQKIYQNDSKSETSSQQNTTIFDTANKILFQFENFAEYTKGEVVGIVASLDERKDECQQSLDLLTVQLIPQHERHAKDNLQTQADTLQFQACKEHIEALKLHIVNTQQFLLKESQQIESKIAELQVSVSKDIEIIMQSQQISLPDDRLSALSSIQHMSQARHRHTLSQELPQSVHNTADCEDPMTLTQPLTKTTMMNTAYANLVFSSCSPSKNDEDQSNKEEISILMSPQQDFSGTAAGGGILRSQISTIPEEETDQEFAYNADQQSSIETQLITVADQQQIERRALSSQIATMLM